MIHIYIFKNKFSTIFFTFSSQLSNFAKFARIMGTHQTKEKNNSKL